jgi:hypothetical protein
VYKAVRLHCYLWYGTTVFDGMRVRLPYVAVDPPLCSFGDQGRRAECCYDHVLIIEMLAALKGYVLIGICAPDIGCTP